MRRVGPVLLLALSALAGCGWVGGPFYTATETLAPIPAGDYRADAGDHPSLVHIAVLPDGMTRFGPVEDATQNLAGFAPLDPANHLFVVWIQHFNGHDLPADELPYGLAEARPDGSFLIHLPDCRDDRQAALAGGATVTGEVAPECHFRDRTGLERALRGYAGHRGEALTLTPIHHG